MLRRQKHVLSQSTTPFACTLFTLGECQSIAQKGVRAIDARNSQLENGSTTGEREGTSEQAQEPV